MEWWLSLTVIARVDRFELHAQPKAPHWVSVELTSKVEKWDFWNYTTKAAFGAATAHAMPAISNRPFSTYMLVSLMALLLFKNHNLTRERSFRAISNLNDSIFISFFVFLRSIWPNNFHVLRRAAIERHERVIDRLGDFARTSSTVAKWLDYSTRRFYFALSFTAFRASTEKTLKFENYFN